MIMFHLLSIFFMPCKGKVIQNIRLFHFIIYFTLIIVSIIYNLLHRNYSSVFYNSFHFLHMTPNMIYRYLIDNSLIITFLHFIIHVSLGAGVLSCGSRWIYNLYKRKKTPNESFHMFGRSSVSLNNIEKRCKPYSSIREGEA